MDQAQRIDRIIMEQLCVDEDQVTPDAELVGGLGADSLDIVELVIVFETEFGIEISDERCSKLATVGDCHAVIRETAAAL
jgi:acyl carrier protein